MASLDQLKAELDALRPLPAATLASLSRWFAVELAYTSNALEGNALTRAETAIVIEKGLTVAGKPLADHLEAVSHRDAYAFVESLADRAAEPVRLDDVLSIHRLVLQPISPRGAGRLREAAVRIGGSAYVPPAPFRLPALMREFGDWLAAAADEPEAAFEAHLRLVTIHPFLNGNGRTARLLMNLKLLRGGWPPAVIRPDQRAAYLDALESATASGDPEAFRSFSRAALAASLEGYLAVARLNRQPSAGEGAA